MPARKLTAVLLDDHQVVLDGLVTALSAGGFRVLAGCRSADDALAAVAEGHPDLLVCDWWLTEASALSVISGCRTSSPRTKIAVLTGHEDGNVASAALRAGATGFLIKDALTTDLVERLREVAAGQLVIDSRVSASVLLSGQGPKLTGREQSIVAHIALGLTNREIARELNLSAHTVKEHVAHAMRKLGTTSRGQTAVVALREGYVSAVGAPARVAEPTP